MTQPQPSRGIRALLQHSLVTAIIGALAGAAGTWAVDRNMVHAARETARVAEQRAAFADVWGQAERFALKRARYDDFASVDDLAAKMPDNPVSSIFRNNYRALGTEAHRAQNEARDALAAKRLLLSDRQYDTAHAFIETASAADTFSNRGAQAHETSARVEALRATAKSLLAADD